MDRHLNLVSIDTQGRSLTRYVTERPRLAVLERTHERSSTRAIQPQHNNQTLETYQYAYYLFDCYSGCNRCYKRDEKRPIMVHTRFAFFRREFYIYVSDLFLRDKITQELFVLCCLYMHRSVVPDIPPYNPLGQS